MSLFNFRQYKAIYQYLISIFLIGITLIFLYFSSDYIRYNSAALILLLTVSIAAMLFDIFPVLLTAILSALIWNFFFIPPTFTFHIGTTEDALMFLMYFVIALINAILTFKIREFEKNIREKEEREKSIILYNTLLNSLSHELRTPIATIIGTVDTLKEHKDKLSEEIKKDLFSEIEIASLRLNRQVDNLLNMSKLEAGVLKPKPDWVDISELIYKIIQNHEADIHNHHIVFAPPRNLPLFKIDIVLTEQILQNIIHNALQYTPIHSTITIQIGQFDNGCFFIIEDNGNGFPEERIQYVFDKFYRLPQSLAGGTGLGLSIAKGFTEALGGTIILENISTGGARFTVTIPAQTTLIKSIDR